MTRDHVFKKSFLTLVFTVFTLLSYAQSSVKRAEQTTQLVKDRIVQESNEIVGTARAMEENNIKEVVLTTKAETPSTLYEIKVNNKDSIIRCTSGCDSLKNALFVQTADDTIEYILGAIDSITTKTLLDEQVYTRIGEIDGKEYYQYKVATDSIIELNIKHQSEKELAVKLKYEEYFKTAHHELGLLTAMKKVKVYRKNYIPPTLYEVDEVKTTIKDANFVETFIKLKGGDVFYSHHAISTQDYFSSKRPLRCYQIKDSGRVITNQRFKKRPYVLFGDVLNYDRKSFALFRPNNKYNLTLSPQDDKQNSYKVIQTSDIKRILELSIYTDILGLVNEENNPLGSIELRAFQRPNTRSLGTSFFIPFHFFKERIRINRFGGNLEQDYAVPFKYDLANQPIMDTFYGQKLDTLGAPLDTFATNAITLDRALLYQNTFFNFDFTAGLLEYMFNNRIAKTQHKLFFDGFVEAGLVRVRRQEDSLLKPNRLLLLSYGGQLGADFKFSRHLSMRLNFKLFKQKIYKTELLRYPLANQLRNEIDQTSDWFTKSELRLSYNAPNTRNRLFFRTSVVNNHNPFTKGHSAKRLGSMFYQVQIGYTRDISSIFNTKLGAIK